MSNSRLDVISDIQKERQLLESKIGEFIQSFESATGMDVYDLSLDAPVMYYSGGAQALKRVVISVGLPKGSV